MRKIVVLLFLPVIFIILGIFIKDLFCIPILCSLFSFPFFEIILLILNLFVIWVILITYRYKGVFLVVLLLALQPLSWFVSYMLFGNAKLDLMMNSRSAYERQQHDDTIKIGKITKSANTVEYSCKICGYQIDFPKNWGYQESAYSSDIDLSQLVLFTPTYNFGSKFLGQRFWIMSTTGDPFNLFQNEIYLSPSRSETLKVGTSPIEAKIFERHEKETNPPNVWYLSFDSPDKKRHYGIKVDYDDEQEMRKSLGIILSGFQFLE